MATVSTCVWGAYPRLHTSGSVYPRLAGLPAFNGAYPRLAVLAASGCVYQRLLASITVLGGVYCRLAAANRVGRHLPAFSGVYPRLAACLYTRLATRVYPRLATCIYTRLASSISV